MSAEPIVETEHVAHKFDDEYVKFTINTMDGLRAQCFIDFNTNPFEPHTLYANGDRKYALAAYTVFICGLTGKVPEIGEICPADKLWQ